eukprot:CAMPEP_0185724182 /NCGR_PEP_ID=MMETSP1171-20130828/733_1 /TAXON_ID=374046 /ORGANISM="Helicotheca tamensis, Strain CCMP826" /LENGTH=154 /DNA_ID=CAMNT_0028391977 /DNA_START=90 /DNA_END=554 /DNA_ORIENTATION=+
MKSIAVLLSPVVAAPLSVSAWLSSGILQSCHTPLHKRRTLNKARNNDDESDLIEFYRNSLERTYSAGGFSDDHSGSFFDEGEGCQLPSDDQVVLTTANIYNTDWFEACSQQAEDWEQCEIPDDFKILSSANTGDIMSFLGIRRAEPLRVERKRE